MTGKQKELLRGRIDNILKRYREIADTPQTNKQVVHTTREQKSFAEIINQGGTAHIFLFKDGGFQFYTTFYEYMIGNFVHTRYAIFRVRVDTTLEKRAKEKGLSGYFCARYSTTDEITAWLMTHPDYPVLKNNKNTIRKNTNGDQDVR